MSVDLWLLALGFLRVLPAVLLLPLALPGAWTWPLRVAVAFALALGVTLAPTLSAPPSLAVVARELLLGGGLALLLALPLFALEHAAALLASQGAAFDAAGRAVSWAGGAAFLAARGHHGALRVLAASWELVPPGGAFPDAQRIAEACMRATAEALAGALVLGASGLLAVAVVELVAALVGRLAWPLAREDVSALRVALGVGVVAVALRAAAEGVVVLAARSHELARAVM